MRSIMQGQFTVNHSTGMYLLHCIQGCSSRIIRSLQLSNMTSLPNMIMQRFLFFRLLILAFIFLSKNKGRRLQKKIINETFVFLWPSSKEIVTAFDIILLKMRSD